MLFTEQCISVRPRNKRTAGGDRNADDAQRARFFADEKILYVIDSGAIQAPRTYYEKNPHAIYAFDVIDGKKLGNQRLFTVVSPGFPDGMRLDANGNIYVGALDGVQVFDLPAN